MRDYIFYNASDIDSVITAAVLQHNGYGKAIRHFDPLLKCDKLHVLGEFEKLPEAREVLKYVKYDIDLIDLDSEYKAERCTYLFAVGNDLLPVNQISEPALRQYAILLTRLQKCDSYLSNEQMAVIHHLFDRALDTINKNEPFELCLTYQDTMLKGFVTFLTGIKKLVSEKLHHRTVDISRNVLGFPIRKPKNVTLGLINTDLSMTPWIIKLTSYSLEGVVVYEYNRDGSILHAHQTFTDLGYLAYKKLITEKADYV